ncbi:hypothetical protein BJ165DRAFT_1402227 [Panaeolus papilionaceus]|nr:hypothetical protein BJ165DRAFT_1402227 [Panaeolus papilionaceus]
MSSIATATETRWEDVDDTLFEVWSITSERLKPSFDDSTILQNRLETVAHTLMARDPASRIHPAVVTRGRVVVFLLDRLHILYPVLRTSYIRSHLALLCMPDGDDGPALFKSELTEFSLQGHRTLGVNTSLVSDFRPGHIVPYFWVTDVDTLLFARIWDGRIMQRYFRFVLRRLPDEIARSDATVSLMDWQVIHERLVNLSLWLSNHNRPPTDPDHETLRRVHELFNAPVAPITSATAIVNASLPNYFDADPFASPSMPPLVPVTDSESEPGSPSFPAVNFVLPQIDSISLSNEEPGPEPRLSASGEADAPSVRELNSAAEIAIFWKDDLSRVVQKSAAVDLITAIHAHYQSIGRTHPYVEVPRCFTDGIDNLMKTISGLLEVRTAQEAAKLRPPTKRRSEAAQDKLDEASVSSKLKAVPAPVFASTNDVITKPNVPTEPKADRNDTPQSTASLFGDVDVHITLNACKVMFESAAPTASDGSSERSDSGAVEVSTISRPAAAPDTSRFTPYDFPFMLSYSSLPSIDIHSPSYLKYQALKSRKRKADESVAASPAPRPRSRFDEPSSSHDRDSGSRRSADRPRLAENNHNNQRFPPSDPRHYGPLGVIGELEIEFDMMQARINTMTRIRDFIRSLIETVTEPPRSTRRRGN